MADWTDKFFIPDREGWINQPIEFPSTWNSSTEDIAEDFKRAHEAILETTGYEPIPPPVVPKSLHDRMLRWLKAYGIIDHDAVNFTMDDAGALLAESILFPMLYRRNMGEGEDEQWEVFDH